MNELVKRLAEGEHAIEAGLQPEQSAAELKRRIERGYGHIQFVDTRGGTELGMRLDPAACDVGLADFAKGTGRVHLVGNLTLNYDKVRLIADVDVGTLKGQGRL